MENQRLIETLSGVPDEAREAFAAVGEERSKQPLDGGWSPRQILGHLKDAAQIYDERVTRVLSEDNPYVLNVDENEAVARGNYNAADPAAILRSLAEYRGHTVELLRSLNEEAWERPGVHSERGAFTLRSLVEYMVDHDANHLADIRRAASG